MAERKFFSRYNMRCGLVMRAKEANLNIKEIKVPTLDQRFLLLKAEDIEKNEIQFMDSKLPILADKKLSYIGEPVLALFGPDFESVEIMMRQIEIITEPANEKTEEEEDEIAPLFFSWGQDEAIRSEDESKYKVIDSELTLEPTTYISALRYTVTVSKEKESLHISLPTEWPNFVKSAVASATGQDIKSINLKQTKLQAKRDEYLFMPAIYAVLGAIATTRLALPVELRAVGESARAGMIFTRHTILSEDNKPLSESVEVEVDQGAYIVAGEEMQRQIMTGLIPPYPLKSFIAKIITKKSNNYPASFSGSLGYTESLAATEYHYSRILEKSGVTPAMQKAQDKSKTRFTDYAPSYELETVGDLVKRIEKESVFDRKWAANNFQNNNSFTIVGYLKGIGIATGSGIAGFSTNTAKKSEFLSTINYTQKKNITVNSFAKSNDKLMKYWKNLISARIDDGGNADNVIFLEPAAGESDAGPDVLSRFYSCYTAQLAAAAKGLNLLLLKDKPPLSLIFSTENQFYPCEFEHSGFGAVITEVKISSLTFEPVVTEVWANFALSHIVDKMETFNMARCSILTSLEECGAKLSSDFKLHLYIDVKSASSEILSSIDSLARSLTMGSFINALAQVAGAKAASIPTSAKKIERALNGGAK